jgi:hypothetical protein
MMFNDTISQNVTNPELCLEKQYDLMDTLASNFLKVVIPADVWKEPYQLSLYTIDPTLVGNYTITYMVSLPKFPMVEPLLV